MENELQKAKRQAFRISLERNQSDRDKANAFRSVALLAIELKQYDTAIEFGELALSFIDNQHVGDIQTIQVYVINRALALKESEGE